MLSRLQVAFGVVPDVPVAAGEAVDFSRPDNLPFAARTPDRFQNEGERAGRPARSRESEDPFIFAVGVLWAVSNVIEFDSAEVQRLRRLVFEVNPLRAELSWGRLTAAAVFAGRIGLEANRFERFHGLSDTGIGR